MTRLTVRQAGTRRRACESEPEAPAGAVQTLDAEDDVVREPATEDATAKHDGGGDEEASTDATTQVDSPERDAQPSRGWRHRARRSRAIAGRSLPVLALLLALVVAFLRWQDAAVRDPAAARGEAIRAATDGTIALLSYRADTVQSDLDAAKSRLTGTFLQAYTSLTHDVVIPGAKQKQISAVATVPGAASTSVSASHAVVLLFVNQTVTVGQEAPRSTSSTVRVGLDNIGGRWLISQFDPV